MNRPGHHLNPDTDLPILLQRTPTIPGWLVSSLVVDGPTIHASTTTELAAALATLWRNRRRDRYDDVDDHTTRDGHHGHHIDDVAPRPPGRVSNTSWNAALWTPLPGGWWLSPIGKRYRPGTEMVRRVEARRRAQGLSTRYAGEQEETVGQEKQTWKQDWMQLP